EVGFEFRGSGASAGVTVNFRTEIGGSNANSVTTRTTTGYVFDDDDVGDFISSTVATDPVYGTPVFKSLGGSTRCPWEEGTAKRDYSTIRVLNPIQYGFPGQNELFYTFFLGNQSETGSPGNYELTLTNASNPGALVTSGAQSLATGLQYYGLQPGETTIEVKVARNMGSPLYSFEGLEFCFYPLCDTAQAACTRISSFFKSPCSDIVLGNVADDWLINSTSNNMMNINLSGYDLNTTINEVRLEYAPTGSNSWLPSNIILSKNDLSANPAGTNKVWQTANIPDGQYDIRLRLDCGVSLNYSERRSGRIDRTPPLVYGKQQPLDDDYSPGDEISVLFTEPINCSSLSNNNVMLKMLPQNTLIPAQLVCDDQKITVTPNYDISGMLKQSFEVQITGVKDLYGNQTIGPVVWTFNVGDPDSDMDGISDSQDRCPGSDDYVDTDLGGKPDGCDCLPEISYNDAVLDCIACTSAANTVLDFDGMNDKIEIPKRFGSIVNSFTYEFWVRPLDSLPIGLTEGSSAFATNHLPFVIFPAQGGVYYGNGITTAGIAVGINGLLLMEHTDNYAPNVIVRYTPINGWNHIAVVYNNRQPSIYLNGNLLASSGVSPATMISPSPVIGGDFYNIFGNTDFFRGQIDELRFWDYARTETQINQQLFNQPSSTTPGLEAYYKFEGATAGGNNTSIDSLVDATGKHNGNMINMDKMGSSSNWIHGPITTIADDDGDGVDNGCDVCATGDDKLDLDKDGIPDGCDHCTNIALQIDSNFGALDGIYTSSQKILILPGAIFPAGNDITLKAPSVEMQSDISVPLTTLLTILNEGCVN
ncbi:MAG: Ig-like domain-containing protein, partial [Saprospiraceae bacterium]|nr:Ig-like domain-containing protein [Saprospiraceae bacterium]